MLDTLGWLCLEVKQLDSAAAFYRDRLELPAIESPTHERRFDAGPSELWLRRPTSAPRGGVHTHFAFSIPNEEYDRWLDLLRETHEVYEHDFGGARALYCYDPEGNCVELGQQPVDGPGIDGIFEVVLEVLDLDTAVECYEALGFEIVDRGTDRRRVRLDGPMALELWEPQLGIADARGGLHVDLGFGTSDPAAAADRIESWTQHREATDDGVRVVDSDGHSLTFYRT